HPRAIGRAGLPPLLPHSHPGIRNQVPGAASTAPADAPVPGRPPAHPALPVPPVAPRIHLEELRRGGLSRGGDRLAPRRRPGALLPHASWPEVADSLCPDDPRYGPGPARGTDDGPAA